MQGWRFLVLTDAKTKKKVRQVGEAAQKAVMAQDGPGWAGKYEFTFIEQAPFLVAVTYNPAKNGLGFYFNQPHGALMAASALIQNFMLAAWEEGLGSLWFTFYDPKEMKKILGVPDKWELAGVIPLGWPEGELKAPPRKEAVIDWEKWGD
jgi:nitroreductase